jgi:hypothetical protein
MDRLATFRMLMLSREHATRPPYEGCRPAVQARDQDMRIKIRAVMFVITLVALSIGWCLESWNRTNRDTAASGEAAMRRFIADHERELAECRRHAGDASYDPSRLVLRGATVAHFESWAEEAEFHEGVISYLRMVAENYAERKRFFQKRLLFP